MSTDLKIAPFTSQDLSVIAGLQPEGWPDIFPSIEYYCKSDFCFPLKASLNDEVVGIGALIVHGNTGWLAHIIVHRDHRNVGIGSSMTKALIELGHKNLCRTLLLIATALGEPVYKKFGFEVDTQYVFFDDGTLSSKNFSAQISILQQHDEQSLFKMDRLVSGEDRKKLLQGHLNNVQVVFEDNTLKGFYMPTLGDGLIIADSPGAGLALMKLRMGSTKKFCIPLLNEHGINFLHQNGFTEYRRASRMILGERIPWDGSKIYNRIGGNLG